MRVYDIVALTEELDVKPGVLGSDGKPVSWQVVDKQTGRVAQTFSGPDADGKAEEFRDAENARRRGVSSGPKTAAEPDALKTDPKKTAPETFDSKWQKFMGSKWVKFLTKYVGINIVVWVQLRRDLQKVYDDYWVNNLIKEDEYEKRSAALFGNFAITILSPLIAKALITTPKLVLSGFRTWNALSSLLMSSTLIASGVAIIKFVLFEAAAWIAIAALSTSPYVQGIFTKFMIEGVGGDFMAEFTTFAKGAVQTIGTALDNKTIYNASRDLEKISGLSPNQLRLDAIKGGGGGKTEYDTRQSNTDRKSGGMAMDLD